ncbi:hypothetical protein ASPSYDRAFT_95905 [Aspergillus sydowii CBS 593.65]|uniref:F-box domain-containing protein n=1 Tax=Aspergillus sydowii CBS 593.65 TaxID=1036612 RepID=A0A1L9SYV1_9EURO|nr:uncharacterized protein ASPSYDRAFT_95905 [Aspergillus sydowii CBS 593.65]OJJ52213.1 hypothetical protein ASPSYDRAFT_95905 [Aspergillus sydowii CBS 593.65]
MGHDLPFELVAQIAHHRRDDSQRFLTQYALVGRTWQAVFEPLIYDRVCIHSELFEAEKGATSIEALRSRAPHVLARHKMIREILYCIILPWDLPDYERLIVRTPAQTYSPHSLIRRANNEVFEAAIVKLFGLLTCIDAEQRVTIRIETIGRAKGHEPGTLSWHRSGAARGKRAVRPYRAGFSNRSVPLRRAPCVDRIIADGEWLYPGKGPSEKPYSKRIRPEAACWIAQACPTLSAFEWEIDDIALPEHLEYAQDQRKYFAQALPHLPATLQTFKLQSLTIELLHESLPAPVLCSKEHDLLSTNLHHLSVQLRELHLEDVPLANDFLCPLDGQGTPRGESLHWPNLENIQISRLDFLPSGEWLKDPGPIVDQDLVIGDIDDPDFDYAEAVERLNGPHPSHTGQIFWDRDFVNRELYLLSCISLGYAARGMPRLHHMLVEYTEALAVGTDMSFYREKGEVEATLTWDGNAINRHEPDERVAHAWRFALSGLVKTESALANEPMYDFVRYKAQVPWNDPEATRAR